MSKKIERLAHITPAEYAELDKMIATAKRLKGQQSSVSMGRIVHEVPISELRTVRVYLFVWSVNGHACGMIGWRPYGDDEGVAAFQAVAAKYFSDGVEATSVVMHTDEGTEKLR